jgi:plastocyanin
MILGKGRSGEVAARGDALTLSLMPPMKVASIARLAAAGAFVACLGAGRAPRTVVVRLDGNQFRPERIDVRAGDSVRFVNGNGGPHNIMFVGDSIAPAARKALEVAMKGEKIGPLSSPLLLDPGEPYAFVVPDIPDGRYLLVCLPHQAQMRASLIVSR